MEHDKKNYVFFPHYFSFLKLKINEFVPTQRAVSSVNEFRKKLISQKHFDWVIVKLVLILDDQNSKIWEIIPIIPP